MVDKDFYNSSSAAKLGWTPEWFGCSEFDYNLVKAVKTWQKNNGLRPDGLVGPVTYRRIWTDRESKLRYLFEDIPDHENTSIMYNNDYFDIDWPRVVPVSYTHLRAHET